MRKAILIVVMSLMLLLGIMPALAVPAADLNALGRYFPADTPMLISFRTDDDFIEEMDALLDRLRTAFPDEFPADSFRDMLDDAASYISEDATFDSEMRAWLGDVASIGLTSFEMLADTDEDNDDDSPGFVALSITDRAAAVDFFTRIIESDDSEYQRTDEGAYTLLTNPDSDAAIFVGDDAVLFTNYPDLLPVEGVPVDNLSANPAFTDTLALLPEADYNATLYLDLPAILKAAATSDPEAAEAMNAFGSLMGRVGPQVWGFTILDETALTLDVVQGIGDLSTLEGEGFSAPVLPPVDPAFARFLPANAPLVIQGTDINANFTANLDNMMFMARQQGAASGDFSPEEIEEMMAQIEQGFTALTGLDLRDDLLSWMTGDYALFVSLSPTLPEMATNDMPSEMPFEFGFAVEVTDPAAAQTTVTGLSRTFNQLAALISAGAADDPDATTSGVTTEEIGGATVTVLTIKPSDVSFPVEVLLGANDDVFALGTRSAVTTILTGDGGLAANPRYISAQALAVPNASSFAWLNMEGLAPLREMVNAVAPPEEAASAQAFFDLIESGSATSALDEDGNNRVRMVLTLAE